MKSKTIVSLFALLFILLALACTDSNDLGEPCTLIKKEAVPLTEAEARDALKDTGGDDKDTRRSRDLVSLGVAECEDLACVRDSKFDPGPVAASAPARGYCSQECQSAGSTCKASNSKTKYVCRQLMLDQEAWARACEVNPSYCINRQSTLFCVRE